MLKGYFYKFARFHDGKLSYSDCTELMWQQGDDFGKLHPRIVPQGCPPELFWFLGAFIKDDKVYLQHVDFNEPQLLARDTMLTWSQFFNGVNESLF